MTIEEFIKVFENEDYLGDWTGDNVYQGLMIINKYMKDDTIICGVGHEMLCSVNIDDIVKSGITLEDAQILRSLNWMIEDGEYLACFV